MTLHLDHQKKLDSIDSSQNLPETSQCIFVQAFQELREVSPTKMRMTDQGGRIFSVSFAGEAGIDAGGVFREGITEIVEDLHSDHFSLFILCPNGTHHTGTNMDKYLPNPACTSPLSTRMYEFVGMLMGISLRTKATLPFSFPSFVWRGLLNQQREWSDLGSFPHSFCIHFVIFCDIL